MGLGLSSQSAALVSEMQVWRFHATKRQFSAWEVKSSVIVVFFASFLLSEGLNAHRILNGVSSISLRAKKI